jgi:tRNA A-37 threonylcarbamoyl transferase component Bud32
LQVRCTCCDAVMTVDASTGAVLFTEKPKKKGLSFEEALNNVHKEKETAEDRFKEAFEKEQTRLKSVEGKFEEAMKRADELEEPIRPLDYD